MLENRRRKEEYTFFSFHSIVIVGAVRYCHLYFLCLLLLPFCVDWREEEQEPEEEDTEIKEEEDKYYEQLTSII